jgi:glutathione S-transferase
MPVPGFLQGVVFSLTSSKLSSQAKAQGLGRHSKPEVEKMCLDDLRAVSAHLGGKHFMFGNEPCLLDAVVFAFVTGAITSPDEDDGPIKKAIMGEDAELANLKQHFDRMKEKFYPDWDELLWKPKPKPEKTAETKEKATDEKDKAKEEDKPAEAEAAKAN